MAKKKKVDPIQVTSQLIEELHDTLDSFEFEWERYEMNEIKAGAKEARKLSLQLKKKAAELRASFGDLGL